MRKLSGFLLPLIACSSITIADSVRAEQPYGWIGNGHTSAYALQAGEFELSGKFLQVDDNIDFLDVRDDLLAGNRRLVGNSGDLSGAGGELRVGVWRGLELFYRQQEQELTLKIGPTASADIVDLDQELNTRSTAWGAKWVFYESARRNRNRSWNSAALELTRTENRSDDFGGALTFYRIGPDANVQFDPPQRFRMDRLEDDGWQARLIISSNLGATTTVSAWAGYGKSESSAGTNSEIDLDFLHQAFLQTFDTREEMLMAGASINWQYFPRLPVQLGYEYIRIHDRKRDIVSDNSTLIPSFLRGGNVSGGATRNHTLYGSVNWWITPNVYLGAGGKLFSNQFTGVIPHYDNPLSGSFSETTYGYAEFKLGIRFGPVGGTRN